MERYLPAKWMLQTLVIITILFLFFSTINQIQALNQKANVLRVTAEGKVKVVPDTATVRIGVISEGANLEEVKNTNNLKMNQVIAFIKKQNINSEDIKTTDYFASPKYNYTNGQSMIVGYQANQTITVTVRKVDKSRQQLQTILGGVVAQGANTIQGVNFSLENTDSLKNDAQKIAIEKAKTKAKQLANEVGLRLGKPINITIQSNDYINPIPAMASFQAKASPTIEPGQQEVTENITIEFEVYKK